MPNSGNADLVHEQVISLGRKVAKESEDLDYIINKIQTSVDFVAVQAQATIEQWKQTKLHQRKTLEDLKYKFRLDTFSIDDGWGLLYSYPNWIEKQRDQLLNFIGQLSDKENKTGNVLHAADQAEKHEWTKDLDMNMDVIFILQEIRDIFSITVTMQTRLKTLETACKKRSDQVMSPDWEPKGLL